MKKLFLLDGMALAYRAHFALGTRPIFTSRGLNTTALFGFVNTLVDLLQKEKPTHLAVVLDTDAPTQRHIDFPAYKAQRQAMPEDLATALPHIARLVEGFRVPLITLDGYEADDIIGTLARRAEKEDFETYMVTPDKDFGQLVSAKTFIYKPSRAGDGIDILGVPEILAKWGIERVEQVIDILGLWGDTSDNIPGVPGIGEKTAQKLIAQYGSIENLLAHTAELKGKQKESLETHRDNAILSKKLATILVDAPIPHDPESLLVQEKDTAKLRELFAEFEFRSLARRVLGEAVFVAPSAKPIISPAAAAAAAARGAGQSSDTEKPARPPAPKATEAVAETGELDLGLDDTASAGGDEVGDGDTSVLAAKESLEGDEEGIDFASLKTHLDIPHVYEILTSPEQRAACVADLLQQPSVCFDLETNALDCRTCAIVGLAVCHEDHRAAYIPFPADPKEAAAILEEFRPFFENAAIEKVGHNLKFDLSVLSWRGIVAKGRIFDTMVAHALVEPEQRHGMDYLAAVMLGYAPISIETLIGAKAKGKTQLTMFQVPLAQIAEYAAEDADVAWQLRSKIEPLLREKKQEEVFYDIECPLVPVLVAMEAEGVTISAETLADFSATLGKDLEQLEQTVYAEAGTTFNLNSDRQLGDILFKVLSLGGAAKIKKTKTGQAATDRNTLLSLAVKHPIVAHVLEYKEATKLKNTYVDALPSYISKRTGRVHTTYGQVMTATGRLNSNDPNLQNIPIRTEQGRSIRKAFIARGPETVLLSADYSQIELRIIAALSNDPGMVDAFASGEDIHKATASKVYGVPLDQVSAEMRRNAKTVNFGIAYGISAFGLSQRLAIPRKEAGDIINAYFKQYAGIQQYMTSTIEFCRAHGYVETMSGRRRYLRDIRSANQTTRGAAERNAINAPIQGTAADMIKIAMVNIDRELNARALKTRMILQVHDELVFELWKEEEEVVKPLVADLMRNAIPGLKVPIVVDMGTGHNWLEAH